MDFLSYYLLAANLFGFVLFGIDKEKARRHLYRIPERVLFLAALLGGSAGCWAGMYFFRHKTKHPQFVFGIPAILAAELLVAAVAAWKLG